MLSGDVQRSGVVAQSKRQPPSSLAAVMVHVDLERDWEPRIELAMGLADRFQATLIGVAGCATWPAFMAGDLELTKSNQYEFQKIMARFAQRGEKFRAEGRWLKQVEWRSMLEHPESCYCGKQERPICSSSAGGAAAPTLTPACFCCGRAAPFCWCPTLPVRSSFAGWS